MGEPSKKYGLFVIVLTVCLAAILVFVVTAKFKTPDTTDPSQTEYSFDVNTFETSRENIETARKFLEDAKWEDMKFILSGVEYALPLDVSELEKHGWSVYSEEIVKPNDIVYFEAYNGNASVKGYLNNASDSNKSAKKCQIVNIGFCWANAILPKNIEIMKSSIRDVYSSYGEPLRDDPENRSVVFETVDYSAGFDAFVDENRPGVAFFYDENGIVVFAELYCGDNAEEAK